MLSSRLIIVGILFLGSCATSTKLSFSESELDAEPYYDAVNVKGAFLACDLETNICKHYNLEMLETAYTPASTFKIVNSIIALETGVMNDLSDTITWDGIKRPIENWNANSDMKAAYKNSTVWFYQEVARRIGEKRMKEWLKKLDYGNKSIEGGIDQFWLTGELRITPIQQMVFLKQLVNRRLPISEKTYEKIQELMVYEQTENYTMRAKTGWGMQDSQDIGWFVGYVTVAGKHHIFVNVLNNSDENNKKFVPSRIEIAKNLLRELRIITF